MRLSTIVFVVFAMTSAACASVSSPMTSTADALELEPSLSRARADLDAAFIALAEAERSDLNAAPDDAPLQSQSAHTQLLDEPLTQDAKARIELLVKRIAEGRVDAERASAERADLRQKILARVKPEDRNRGDLRIVLRYATPERPEMAFVWRFNATGGAADGPLFEVAEYLRLFALEDKLYELHNDLVADDAELAVLTRSAARKEVTYTFVNKNADDCDGRVFLDVEVRAGMTEVVCRLSQAVPVGAETTLMCAIPAAATSSVRIHFSNGARAVDITAPANGARIEIQQTGTAFTATAAP